MPVKITINFSDPVDPDAFVRHYLDVHVPLVNALPGLRGFEYGRAVTNFDGSPPDVFWVISMTFDDEAAMHSASRPSTAPQARQPWLTCRTTKPAR